MNGSIKNESSVFESAKERILKASFRTEIDVREIAAPERIAPYAVALAANVKHHGHETSVDSEAGAGRFVLLYNPEFQTEWAGNFRVICFASAPLEQEISTDPFIAEVAWSWLTDSLEDTKASYTNLAGTTTNTISTGFGSLAAEGSATQIELRASWTPTDENFEAHAKAWSNIICMLAGYPSLEGAASLDMHRNLKKK